MSAYSIQRRWLMTTKYTLQDKINHLATWRSSGLTRVQYASEHNINFNSFKNWHCQIKKIQQESVTPVIVPVTVTQAPVCAPILPVTAHPEPLDKHTPSTRHVSLPHSSLTAHPQACHEDQNTSDHHKTLSPSDLPGGDNLKVLLPSGLVVICQLGQLAKVMGVLHDA